MRIGDSLTACFDGIDYICEIGSISDEVVALKVVKTQKAHEPSIKARLYMAVPKLDKLESIVQKSTELGVCAVIPVLTNRCVSRPDKNQFSKKLQRLRRIALEAAKQSGRGIVPTVSDIISFEDCLAEMKNCDLGLVCYEKGGISLGKLKYPENASLGLLIGSEGGFDGEEIMLAQKAGIIAVGLGDRILRCETAPIAALSIIMHLTGNM